MPSDARPVAELISELREMGYSPVARLEISDAGNGYALARVHLDDGEVIELESHDALRIVVKEAEGIIEKGTGDIPIALTVKGAGYKGPIASLLEDLREMGYPHVSRVEACASPDDGRALVKVRLADGTPIELEIAEQFSAVLEEASDTIQDVANERVLVPINKLVL